MSDDEERLALEDLTGKVARTLQEAINSDPEGKRVGFCLLMFDFGDKGSFAYAANAPRADVVKLFKEAADKVGREAQ
jgi:hypothetical protein